jgi:hypothetical protein
MLFLIFLFVPFVSSKSLVFNSSDGDVWSVGKLHRCTPPHETVKGAVMLSAALTEQGWE